MMEKGLGVEWRGGGPLGKEKGENDIDNGVNALKTGGGNDQNAQYMTLTKN